MSIGVSEFSSGISGSVGASSGSLFVVSFSSLPYGAIRHSLVLSFLKVYSSPLGTLSWLILALKEKGYSAEDILDILERITQTKQTEKPKG